jgi:cobalt-zinc-cadmium resistance protein CzcA
MDASLRKKYPQVRSVLATIGRAEKGETADVNYMEVLLDMKPQGRVADEAVLCPRSAARCRSSWKRGADRGVRRHAADPDARGGTDLRRARDPGAENLRRGPGHAGPPVSEAQTVLGTVPGVADLSLEANKGKPQMVIKVNREAAARYGINADEILEVVQAGIGGKAVSTLIDGTRRFDIQVRLTRPSATARRRSRHSRSAPRPAPWCRCRASRRWSSTRATPSCAASNCSATPCCNWT